MQKTLHSQPKYTWQQHSVDHSLFCGSVFIAKLLWCGRKNGYEHFRINHAAFPDAISETGWGKWDEQPFDLKGKTFVEVADMVEEFYNTVFDKLAFTMTLK